MKRIVIGFFLIFALVFTNATGYHSHDTGHHASDSADALVMSVSGYCEHTHQDTKKDKDNTAQSDMGGMHSHASDSYTPYISFSSPVRTSNAIHSEQDALLVSGAVKPALEPPSHS